MSEYKYPSCEWHPPGTLLHDVEVLREALREVGRQFVIAAKHDAEMIARAYRRAITGVDA